MNVKKFVEKVCDIERLNIVFYRDGEPVHGNTRIGEYNYKRAAPNSYSVEEFVKRRIPEGFEVEIFDGSGDFCDGCEFLANIRS